MNNLREYWNKKATEWESLTYSCKMGNLNIYRNIVGYFKKPLQYRMNISLDLMKPYIRDKVVLELGCGSGRFCFELIRCGAKKVIGVDISEKMVEIAKSNAKKSNIPEDKCIFMCVDARNMIFPFFDIVAGLGYLDWIGIEEVVRLFKKIKGSYFLFSFSEKSCSISEIFHRIYWSCKSIILTKGVQPFHYRNSEIERILTLNGFRKIKLFKDKRLSFGAIVHNFNSDNSNNLVYKLNCHE